MATLPAADVTIERIGELTEYDLPALIGAAQGRKKSWRQLKGSSMVAAALASYFPMEDEYNESPER